MKPIALKDTKPNIELRALEPEDIDLLYKWENDKDIWQVSNTVTPFSRFVLTKYIESAHLDIYQTRQLRLMIDSFEGGETKTVGAIDLFDFEPLHSRAGIGILIAESEDRNRGYAGATLNMLLNYLKDVLHLHQVYCNILVNNTVSIALFKKHGFSVVGTKKDWINGSAGYIDEILFQKIL